MNAHMIFHIAFNIFLVSRLDSNMVLSNIDFFECTGGSLVTAL